MKFWRCKCGTEFVPNGPLSLGLTIDGRAYRMGIGGDPELLPMADRCPRCGCWVSAQEQEQPRQST